MPIPFIVDIPSSTLKMKISVVKFKLKLVSVFHGKDKSCGFKGFTESCNFKEGVKPNTRKSHEGSL